MSETHPLEFENNPPVLTHISLEQGRVLVRRVAECLNQNLGADLYILVDFGAEPLEAVIREFNTDSDINIEHVRVTRNFSRGLSRNLGAQWKQKILTLPIKVLQEKIGKSNYEFLKQIVAQKKHIVLVDDIEYEGGTLDFVETLIKSINPECKTVKFPIIKSSQEISAKDDGWPFALFDDLGMIKGYKMPWEDDQAQYVSRAVDPKANMKTISRESPQASSLKQDLQRVTWYFKQRT